MRPALAFVALLGASLALSAPSWSQASNLATDPILASAERAQQDGRLADAEKILSDAIHQAEQNDPPNPQSAEYRSQLIFVLHEEGRIADAEKTASEAVKQAEQIGSESPQLARALDQMAWLVGDKGEISEALTLEHRALEIDRNVFGPQDKTLLGDLAATSRLLMAQSKKDEAEEALKQALQITRMNPDISGEEKAVVFVNLSQMYMGERRWAEAEQLLLEAAKNCPNEKNGSPCSYYSYELGQVYRNEGRTGEADKLPSPDPSLPPDILNLQTEAARYNKNGQYVEGEEATRHAIAWIEHNIKAKSQADGHLEFQYRMLGDELQMQGRNDDAEAAYAKAIEFTLDDAVRSTGGATDAAGNSLFGFVGEDFDDLIQACRAAGRLSDAETVIQHVIEVQEKVMGERDPSMVETLVALANIYAEEGDADKTKYAQALPLYQGALEIRQASVGPDDPRLTDVLTPYADLLRKMHRDSEAAALRARIDALEKKDERNVAPGRTP